MDLVTFDKEILNGRLYFLRSVCFYFMYICSFGLEKYVQKIESSCCNPVRTRFNFVVFVNILTWIRGVKCTDPNINGAKDIL